jgi:hypothetical protein
MMRRKNITTLDEANKFLREYYLPEHNSKYARKAAKQGNSHRSADGVDLCDIFTVNYCRVVHNDWTVRCNKQIFQLHKEQRALVRSKDKVNVCKRLDGSTFIILRGYYLNLTEITNQYLKTVVKEVPKQRSIRYIPPKDHPWRRSNSAFYAKRGHF